LKCRKSSPSPQPSPGKGEGVFGLFTKPSVLNGKKFFRYPNKGVKLDCGYRLDVVVGGLVILELKAVDRIEPIHEAQLLTYLKLSDLRLGMLINFNVPILKNGIKRIANGL
jgi:GxxExxY protein